MRLSAAVTFRSFLGLLLCVVIPAGCGASAHTALGRAYGAAPEPMAAAAPVMAEFDKAKLADGAKEKPGAAVSTWKRSELPSHSVRLTVGDKETLPLLRVQAQVRIDGFRARVVLDYLFANDKGRRLEGAFQMRLPSEASPYYFAFGELSAQPVAIAASAAEVFPIEATRKMGLDPDQIASGRATAWLHPKEARIVPKEKAAFAYAATVRRSVDPAIMEWAGAGVFNARVFPLDADKTYRVVVGYDVNLVTTGATLEYRFDVPSGVTQTTVDLDVAEGTTVTVSPEAKALADTGRRLYRFTNPKSSAITARLGGSASLLTGADATGPYFAASFRPVLPATQTGSGSDRAVFLVDTSLSSNPDRFNIWRKLLRSVLDRNRPALKSFAVLFFDVQTHWWRPTFAANTPENVEELLKYAEGLSLEGATDLGAALSEATRLGGEAARPDLFLLSDGASTWGESDIRRLGRLLGGRPLYAYQTGLSGTDSTALSLLTRESGGAVFSIVGEAEVESASVAHRKRPYRLLDVRLAGGADVLLAGRPRFIFPGQILTIAGRGTIPDGAEVTMSLERDGKKETVKTRFGARASSSLAPRIYGQIAVAQLEEIGDEAQSVAQPYATHFRVTGATCSLLMLDTEQDYERYGIRPEADSFVIRQKPASDVIAAALQKLGATLGDPKASFLAWVGKLGTTPGMGFEMPAALRAALEAMPASSFDVRADPLVAKHHERRDLPAAYVDALARHALDYDMVTREASRRKGVGASDALKALSSLVEQSPGDAVLARDVGYSAMEWGLGGQAYHLFRRVASARPYEPQNYRAMAQALAAVGRADLALAWFEIGLVGQYDARFGEFRRILAMDYLRLLRRIVRGGTNSSVPDYAKARLASLEQEFPMPAADLVVMITWNTDGTDVDLHVTEPSGEECYYSHRQTRSGGSLTNDVTQGYGPEMYVLPHAPTGTYRITAHYYAADRNRMSARTKVQATVLENWGTASERVFERVVLLETGKDTHEIMTVVKGERALEIAR